MSNLQNANNDLAEIVENIIYHDSRFAGFSRYIVNINFYWSTAIDTACAGYGFIFFNPDFWNKLDDEQRKTVIAHEIWHLILEHLERGKDKDPETYNQAGDHVINLLLQYSGFPISEDTMYGDILPCCDPQYQNMGTDAVYQILYKQKKEQSNSSNSGSPSNSNQALEKHVTADQIEKMVKQAAEDLQQNPDKLIQENKANVQDVQSSIGMEDYAFEIILQQEKCSAATNLPYNKIFKKYLTDPLSGGKRTYMRPARRQPNISFRLKGRTQRRGTTNRLTHLVYAFDVSGSVTSADRQKFLKSLVEIKELLNPEMMTVMCWDTRIRFEKQFTDKEPIKDIQTKGGGGTSLIPVYKRLETLKPQAVVIFTDLKVMMPPKPSWDTIWFIPHTNLDTSNVTYGPVYVIPE